MHVSNAVGGKLNRRQLDSDDGKIKITLAGLRLNHPYIFYRCENLADHRSSNVLVLKRRRIYVT